MAVLNNGIYPATYQPYVQYQQYPQYQQQYQNAIVQSQQTQTPVMAHNGIVWVNNEQDALSYPIAPNNAVALWESSGKRIYVKSADATGKPSIKTYDLVEHVETESQGDSKELPYAMKEDLTAVVSAMKDLSGVVSVIKGEVDSLKGDVYGIAGKRRPVKKPEAAEEDE